MFALPGHQFGDAWYFYASQLVCLGEKWFLLGTVRDDAGTGISAPLTIAADEKGLHLE